MTHVVVVVSAMRFGAMPQAQVEFKLADCAGGPRAYATEFRQRSDPRRSVGEAMRTEFTQTEGQSDMSRSAEMTSQPSFGNEYSSRCLSKPALGSLDDNTNE